MSAYPDLYFPYSLRKAQEASKPLEVPPIAELPDVTYRQEEAALQTAVRGIGDRYSTL